MKWVRRQIVWIATVAVSGFLVWQVATAVTLHHFREPPVGSLYGKEVPLPEFRRALEAVTHQAILNHGEDYRRWVSPADLERRAWDRLLFLREALRNKLPVADREVIEEIQRLRLFQDKDGRFDAKGYQVVMQYSLGISPRVFEEEIREDLRMRKLMEQVMGQPTATEEEVREVFRRKEETAQFRYFTVHDKHEMLARELADACRQDPGKMQKLARQAGSQIATSDFVRRDGSVAGLGPAAAAFGSAFDLDPGQAGGPFLSIQKGWVIAEVKAKQPPEEASFPALKDGLEKEVVNRKKMQNYAAWYEDLLKRADRKITALPGTDREL